MSTSWFIRHCWVAVLVCLVFLLFFFLFVCFSVFVLIAHCTVYTSVQLCHTQTLSMLTYYFSFLAKWVKALIILICPSLFHFCVCYILFKMRVIRKPGFQYSKYGHTAGLKNVIMFVLFSLSFVIIASCILPSEYKWSLRCHLFATH